MTEVTANTKVENYKTEISVSNHHFLADEPHDTGGQNLGPTPVQLLADSLASCSSITMKMYADRKGWQVDDIEVKISYESDAQHQVSQFNKSVKITGNLDTEQKARIFKIAEHCPVHKILEKSMTIESILI